MWRPAPIMNEKLRVGFSVAVGVGWIFNLVAPVLFSGYQSSLAVNAPLLIILGSLFTAGTKGKQ